MGESHNMPQDSLSRMGAGHRYAYLALMLIRFSVAPVLLAICFLLPFPQLAFAFVVCISVALLAGYSAGLVEKHAAKTQARHRC